MGEVGRPAAAHLVSAVGTVLVHADALGAALHLGVLAAVCWRDGRTTKMELTKPKAFPTGSPLERWGISPQFTEEETEAASDVVCPRPHTRNVQSRGSDLELSTRVQREAGWGLSQRCWPIFWWGHPGHPQGPHLQSKGDCVCGGPQCLAQGLAHTQSLVNT